MVCQGVFGKQLKNGVDEVWGRGGGGLAQGLKAVQVGAPSTTPGFKSETIAWPRPFPAFSTKNVAMLGTPFWF